MLFLLGKKRLNVRECSSFVSQLRGLMFRFKIKEDGYLFVFKKEKQVFLHMFFVFFSIDTVCLNSDKEIVKIIKNVKPFTPIVYCPRCRYILELKRGILDN